MKPWKLVIAGLALGAGAAAIQQAVWPAEKPRDYLVPGDQWLGEPLPEYAALAQTLMPIQVRGGCFWGRPGSNPWRGDTYSALRAMFVEERDAGELASQIRHKASTVRVYRSNLGVRTSRGGPTFTPISAQAFGADIVCFGTTSNFRSDDAEEAGDLYHVGDAWVAVWDACRNVDRLIPVPEGEAVGRPLYPAGKFGPSYGYPGVPTTQARRTAALLYPLVRTRPALRGVPIPRRPVPGGETAPTNQVQSVPEPATLALVFAGLGVGLYTTRRARRRPDSREQPTDRAGAP